MKRIRIVIPYFGILPPPFRFWWQSALANPTVDFLFVTDCGELQTEQNIEVVHMSFDECRALVNSKMDMEVALRRPYKLCDLRPCYGVIFADWLQGYDYWAFGDIDLIYGNIRRFFTDEVLDRYPYISGFGHLTLVRNTDEWNNFFRQRVDGCQYWEDVMSTEKNCIFDEYGCGGLSDMVKAVRPEDVYDVRPFDDLRTPRDFFCFVSECKQYMDSLNLVFEYKDGEMYRVFNDRWKLKKEPTLYVHFKQRQSLIQLQTEPTNHYLFIPNRIIPFRSYGLQDILRWTKCSPWYSLYFYYAYRIGGRLRRIFRR